MIVMVYKYAIGGGAPLKPVAYSFYWAAVRCEGKTSSET